MHFNVAYKNQSEANSLLCKLKSIGGCLSEDGLGKQLSDIRSICSCINNFNDAKSTQIWARNHICPKPT